MGMSQSLVTPASVHPTSSPNHSRHTHIHTGTHACTHSCKQKLNNIKIVKSGMIEHICNPRAKVKWPVNSWGSLANKCSPVAKLQTNILSVSEVKMDDV